MTLYTRILLGILVLAVITSSIFIIDPNFSLTGMVIGVPSSCISSFTINSTDYIEIQPGGLESVNVKIWDVSCGLSRANLELIGIPSEYYTVSPTYLTNVPPGGEGEFIIYFDIPEGTEAVTYTGTFRVYSNEGRFDADTIELGIIEPEKPKTFAEPEVQISEALEPVTGKVKSIPSENVKFWWAVGIGAAILAIIVVGSEYFKRPVEEQVKVRVKSKSKEELGGVLADYKRATTVTGKKKRFFAVLDRYRKKSKKSKA